MSTIKLFKRNFFFKIQTFEEYKAMDEEDETADYIEEAYECEGLIVTAWLGEFMVDQHVTEIYPELEDIGFSEECEGFMVSQDILDKALLESKLQNMGYNTSRDEIEELTVEQYCDVMDKIESELDQIYENSEENIPTQETELQACKRLLDKAVQEEDYLKAAEYRDKIQELENQ